MIFEAKYFKARIEDWEGDVLLFQILRQEKFLHTKFIAKNGIEINSHPQVSPRLGGSKIFLRNGNKDLDYEVCLLYFKDAESLQKYKAKLLEALIECFG